MVIRASIKELMLNDIATDNSTMLFKITGIPLPCRTIYVIFNTGYFMADSFIVRVIYNHSIKEKLVSHYYNVYLNNERNNEVKVLSSV